MRAAEIRQRMAAVIASYRPTHIVQVGAHRGEEVDGWLATGAGRVTLVEPIPHLAVALQDRHAGEPRVRVVQAACTGGGTATVTLHIPARSNMASLRPLSGARQVTVPACRLDRIAPDADVAVIDVQGAELDVLAGAPWDSLRLLAVEALDGVDDPAVAPPLTDVAAIAEANGMRQVAEFSRDYDAVMRWATGRVYRTGGRIVDVVYARASHGGN